MDQHGKTRRAEVVAVFDVVRHPQADSFHTIDSRVLAEWKLGARPDKLLFAAGRRESTDGLGLEEAGVALGSTDGFIKLVFRRADKQLLGVHIVGEIAGELIHLGQAVLHAGDAIDRFMTTTFAIPTRTDLYKYAAYDGLHGWPATRRNELCGRLRFRLHSPLTSLQPVDTRAART